MGPVKRLPCRGDLRMDQRVNAPKIVDSVDVDACCFEDIAVALPRAMCNRKLRQAIYEGAEEGAANAGRPLDEAGLERVLMRYPGDV